MKNFKLIRSAWLLVPALLGLFAACSETDYMTFDTSHNGVYFTKDTLTYSFGIIPVNQRTAVYRIPMRVMGGVADFDRTFSFEVIEDSTTAVEGVQYQLGEAIIPKDSINGYIPVTIMRDGLEGDYQNGYVRYKLGVRLLEGHGFRPTLDAAAQVRVLVFDNAVEQPEWLDAFGQKVWSKEKYGVWHPLKLIKMVEYFHTIENYQPETYEKMVKAFGPNLESVPFGDFFPYNATMKKYVYTPVYGELGEPAKEDEDKRAEILALYPDFLFDFPNPSSY